MHCPGFTYISWITYLSLALWLWMAGCHPARPVQDGPSPAATDATATPPQSNAKDQAIARGIDYLRAAGWEFDFVYLYSYLQPRYGWPDLPAQAEHTRIADSLRGSVDARALDLLNQMALFERLRNPDARLPEEVMAHAREVDRVTVPALYCDHYPLDTARYFPILRQEMTAGNYRLTHALLAYLWLEERQCFPNQASNGLRDALVAANHALVVRFPVWLDLNIEAAALLQAVGEATPDAWIQGVIDAQQRDGGWLHGPTYDASNTHTTLLALWLLAETR